MTRRCLVGLVLALIASPALARRRLPLRVKGAFVGVVRGDYFHLTVKDNAGKDWSFYVFNDEVPSVKEVLAHPERYKGSRLEVTYQRVSKVLPEAGPRPTALLEAVFIRKL